jgi:uncharacterized protein YjbI with pentapeptide repeats
MPHRLDRQQTEERLKALGLIEADDSFVIPDRMPAYDDEDLSGLRFFRTLLSKVDLSNLYLPRTSFGRSQIEDVKFTNADLSESNLNWNDLARVDFGHADLSRADLRGSIFKDVRFDSAKLHGVDLRRSTFARCSFQNASMVGAILTRQQGAELPLTEDQHKQVDWRTDDGREPPGG